MRKSAEKVQNDTGRVSKTPASKKQQIWVCSPPKFSRRRRRHCRLSSSVLLPPLLWTGRQVQACPRMSPVLRHSEEKEGMEEKNKKRMNGHTW